MSTHRSTAFIKSLNDRIGNRSKFEPITTQFRFVIRMAYACRNSGVPYDVQWTQAENGPSPQR